MRSKRERTRESKLICISNGIDTNYFSPHAVKNDRRALNLPEGVLCVTVANFRAEKAYSFQLDILKRLYGTIERLNFVWVGKGPEEQLLRRKADDLGIGDRIHFAGAVEDVRPFLRVSDVFILSSKEEGMPRALMEAMSMGLPVLATRVGGVSEVIDDGRTGILVEYPDVDAAAGKLSQLASNEALRKRIGDAARTSICTTFDVNTMADRFVSFYMAIAGGVRCGG